MRLKGWRTIVWIALSWMAAWSAWAVEVPGLFNVAVPAADDSAAERLRAGRIGMSEVLVRVSGKDAVLSAPAVVSALHNPEAFVQQYAMAVNPDKDPTLPRLFQFRFDQRALLQLLKTNRLPVWSSNRPPLLIWCVDENGDMLSRADSPWQQRLRSAAQKRGLPLIWPYADSQDKSALAADAIAAGISEPVNAASLRYIAGPGSGVVVAAKISRPAVWQAQFLLLVDGKGTQVGIEAASEVELAQKIINYSADSIADRFALALQSGSSAPGRVRLVVDNIENFAAASAVSDYLRRVSAIKTARLVSVNGKSMNYELALEGDVTQLKQAFQLDQKLVASEVLGSTDLNEIHFNWISGQ